MSCLVCDFDSGLERVRYFSRQLISADDMTAEQQYFRQKLRRHNRFVHGWGVVCGIDVKPAPTDDRPWRLRVCPGYVLGPQGDEIVIGDGVYIDVADGATEGTDPCANSWPCPPTGKMPGARNRLVYLAVRYAECDARPQHVHPLGCSCDERSCEYSRTRDDFELRVLWEMPKSHIQRRNEAQAWCAQLKGEKEGNGKDTDRRRLLNPPCPECPDEPWVVLAAIRLPEDDGAELTDDLINFAPRPVLWSTFAIQTALTCDD